MLLGREMAFAFTYEIVFGSMPCGGVAVRYSGGIMDSMSQRGRHHAIKSRQLGYRSKCSNY